MTEANDFNSQTTKQKPNVRLIILLGVVILFLFIMTFSLGLAVSTYLINQREVIVSEAARVEIISEAEPVERAENKAPAMLTKGAPAPDFNLTDLEGNVVALSDFAGQPVIINFWATWCGPCEDEMPDFQEVYEEHKDEGLVILAVNMEEHPDTIKSFVDYYELTFPILPDQTASVGGQYQVRGLPTTYIVDSAGDIVHVQIGQITGYNLKRWLERMSVQ